MTIAAAPPDAEQIKIQYRPRPGLGALVLKNFALNLLTFFIYSFWAKTNVRKHVWSCVHVMEEPLEYTGRGLELALGFLIVVGGVFIPLGIMQALLQIYIANQAAIIGINFVIVVVFVFLFGVAVYRARRYRLSRTLWRGIRGSLAGSSLNYAAQRFGFWLLLSASAMWTYPIMQVQLYSVITNDMRFGNRPFRFQGTPGPLYGKFAVFWFGTFFGFIIMLVGLIVAGHAGAFDAFTAAAETKADDEVWIVVATLLATLAGVLVIAIPYFVLRAFYTAAELNYLAQTTAFEGVTFKMHATTGSLIGLVFLNVLIMLFTLGIASPFVQQNLVRYLCDRLSATGELDIAAIQQSQAEMMQTGEGLAEMFDVDVF